MLLTNADFKEGRHNAQIKEEGSFEEGTVQQLQVGFADPEVVATALMWIYTDRLPKDLPAQHLLEARHCIPSYSHLKPALILMSHRSWLPFNIETMYMLISLHGK